MEDHESSKRMPFEEYYLVHGVGKEFGMSEVTDNTKKSVQGNEGSQSFQGKQLGA